MVNYKLLTKTIELVCKEIPHLISNLANISAIIWENIDRLNWAGFYILEDDILVLGPFQGKAACVEIEMGKGVCGSSALQDKTFVVDNVHDFDGHIACDSCSNSEIVIPIHKDGKVWGVLDIDSPIFNRFDEIDKAGLEGIVKVIEETVIK